jgi:hypothetical protein
MRMPERTSQQDRGLFIMETRTRNNRPADPPLRLGGAGASAGKSVPSIACRAGHDLECRA